MNFYRRWMFHEFADHALILRKAGRGAVVKTVPYADILTAEHRPQPWGLRLHVRETVTPVDLMCAGRGRAKIEARLRGKGIRVVDEYGAMLTPTLAEFERELSREPKCLRQLSDNA